MTRKPAALLLLLLLGGGSGTGIYHYLNRKNPTERTEENKTPEKAKIKILELVNNDALPYDGYDSYGEKLVNKVKTEDNKKKKNFKEGVDKIKLIQGCKDQKEKEIFVENKENNEELKKTREGCIGTIREELGETKALKAKSTDKSEDRESGKVKALILAKYGEEEASTDLSLNAKIKDAQAKAKKTNETKFGNKLTEGCKDVYQLGFKGTSDDIGKLANKFCTKPTNRDMIVGGGLSPENSMDSEGGTKVTTAESDDQVKTIVNEENKKEKLKAGCKDQFKQLISNTTSEDSEDTTTLERIKKLCVLTNKDKLGSDQMTINDGGTDKSKGEGKMSGLEQKTGSNQDLKDISTKHKNHKNADGENNAGKELRAGCKSIQDKGYAGENDADFKLAKEICKSS